tara:strand:+ start:1026 stop:1346 length:321 start_codon:yes stop_codon:yes gene_type:complete
MRTKLNYSKKLLLSVFPIIGILMIIETIALLVVPFGIYLKIWWGLLILAIFQNFILIRRVCMLNIEKNTRALYIILFLTIILFQLYYIWKLDDRHYNLTQNSKLDL